jgi:hypothetical protein
MRCLGSKAIGDSAIDQVLDSYPEVIKKLGLKDPRFRIGTFIYHTHWHDEYQLTNGIYGPLIVLPPGEKFDASSDISLVFSIGNFGAIGEMALINGTPQSKALQLQSGKKYRFRLISISINNQGMQASLRDAKGPVEW